MNRCDGCGNQISKKAKRCPSCAMQVAHRVRSGNKEAGVGVVSRVHKLHDATRKLEEARRLYRIVTGKQMSKYWYNKIRELETQIAALTKGKQHAGHK